MLHRRGRDFGEDGAFPDVVISGGTFFFPGSVDLGEETAGFFLFCDDTVGFAWLEFFDSGVGHDVFGVPAESAWFGCGFLPGSGETVNGLSAVEDGRGAVVFVEEGWGAGIVQGG